MDRSLPAKQQIVERIKQANSILVTVSTDPSVDELAAALGLTMLLNKLEKHATAVVSAPVPPAIEFLEPEKTFETTVDSLRDFIISLDKAKADHLRYKLDGEVVKILITPYRTTIGEKDLSFTQGDYNVEMVIALGVKNREHLDRALAAHGRILHDAIVVTVSAGSQASNLGATDWHDEQASSISEMIVGLSEALKDEQPLLDEPVATAFLTGIVAATDRFSNNLTSSRAMTMAAQLMAAGANQQLIATRLQEAAAITQSAAAPAAQPGDAGAPAEDDASGKDDGALQINHDKPPARSRKKASAVISEVKPTPAPPDPVKQAEDTLSSHLQTMVHDPDLGPGGGEPSLGGTLNATTQQAADDKRRQASSRRNRTLLSHGEGGRAAVDNADKPAPEAAPAESAAAVARTITPPSVMPVVAAAPALTDLTADAKAQTKDTPDAPPSLSQTPANPMQFELTGPATPPPPPPPPLPDFGELPPLPPTSGPALMPPADDKPADPSQFRIPGQ